MRKPLTIDPAILQEVVRRLTEAVGIDAESLETGRRAGRRWPRGPNGQKHPRRLRRNR